MPENTAYVKKRPVVTKRAVVFRCLLLYPQRSPLRQLNAGKKLNIVRPNLRNKGVINITLVYLLKVLYVLRFPHTQSHQNAFLCLSQQAESSPVVGNRLNETPHYYQVKEYS